MWHTHFVKEITFVKDSLENKNIYLLTNRSFYEQSKNHEYNRELIVYKVETMNSINLFKLIRYFEIKDFFNIKHCFYIIYTVL